MFKHCQLYKPDLCARSGTLLKEALYSFLQQPMTYKSGYLQAEYDQANDGYSYWGQTDSKNQYPTDMLHSFVISGFSKHELFPAEFRRFFNLQWHDLQLTVRALEKEIIEQLNMPGLYQFYQENIGHMVSCNYYPATKGSDLTAKGNTRLSTHKDISLFSVFLFGVENGFSYWTERGELKYLGKQTAVVVFPGYLLELLTGGRIKALEHQVELPTESTDERFSFAFFSVPKPDKHLQFAYLDMSTQAYYEKYLTLF